jgi:DTW domain-containing protein
LAVDRLCARHRATVASIDRAAIAGSQRTSYSRRVVSLPSIAAPAPRPTCLRCRRPGDHCYCALIPALPTRTHVVFLQHPRERDCAIGTARMAHLALPHSSWVEGVSLDDHPTVQALFDQRLLNNDDVAVLFPGPTARPLVHWQARPPKTLVVLDGTWWQAASLLKHNPRLAALPRLSYEPERPGNYRIRKEPAEHCLATVEAVCAVLGALEGEPARFTAMLRPFDFLVERQLAAVADRTGPARQKQRRRAKSTPPELLALAAAPERIVVLYGEANSHPRKDRPPGAPELLHLLALSPFTGGAFEAVLRPRRPLAPDVPARLGLSAVDFAAGEDPATALEGLRAFLGDDCVVCAWGPHVRDLLVQEGAPKRGFIDLRALSARVFGKAKGGIPGAFAQLAASNDNTTAPPAQPLTGRGGQMIEQLGALTRALVARAAP